MGRNVSEVRAGLERVDADADRLLLGEGRVGSEEIDMRTCLVCRGIGHCALER
jgi:hypothetical protein